VLAAHWSGELPVDPFSIASHVGAHLVERSDFDDESESLGTASGFFSYDGGKPVIEYNIMDSNERTRFTVAHELGHFLLGHKNVPRDTSATMSRSRDPKEVAANRFAAELLMPAAAVRKLFFRGDYADVDKLADAFKVSRAAMSYRLVNLGLIPSVPA
jgi:Zn-dependent peptidase ImmA (M78 family)